ncbi:MAG: hypothetical protein BWY06_02447 [Candidatus Latescibacteria bacterium ADurb.Bin168]|nr:MAG: hypothetical protein BWY06_02447 [Candidatus Latescibacteria bacterium ADurb.Bin168]
MRVAHANPCVRPCLFSCLRRRATTGGRPYEKPPRLRVLRVFACAIPSPLEKILVQICSFFTKALDTKTTFCHSWCVRAKESGWRYGHLDTARRRVAPPRHSMTVFGRTTRRSSSGSRAHARELYRDAPAPLVGVISIPRVGTSMVRQAHQPQASCAPFDRLPARRAGSGTAQPE